MKVSEEFKTTTNGYVYNRLAKKVWASEHGTCSICPYHRGENRGLSRKIKRSWKYFRKTARHQWKPIGEIR